MSWSSEILNIEKLNLCDAHYLILKAKSLIYLWGIPKINQVSKQTNIRLKETLIC